MSNLFRVCLALVLIACIPAPARADVVIKDAIGLSSYDLVIQQRAEKVFLQTCDNYGARACRPFGNPEGYSLEKLKNAAIKEYYTTRGAYTLTAGTAALAIGLLSVFGGITSAGIVIDLVAANVSGVLIDAAVTGLVAGNLYVLRQNLTDLIEDTVNAFEKTRALKRATLQKEAILAVPDFRNFEGDLDRLLKSCEAKS